MDFMGFNEDIINIIHPPNIQHPKWSIFKMVKSPMKPETKFPVSGRMGLIDQPSLGYVGIIWLLAAINMAIKFVWGFLSDSIPCLPKIASPTLT